MIVKLAAPLTAPEDAVIVAVPAASAVATPVAGLMDANAGLLLVHAIGTAIGLPY